MSTLEEVVIILQEVSFVDNFKMIMEQELVILLDMSSWGLELGIHIHRNSRCIQEDKGRLINRLMLLP